ncbi:MAG: cysteine-rich CWC family protein [Bacteroidota bacterium]
MLWGYLFGRFGCAYYEPKNCPRCGASFECKPGSIANCQCTQVQLTPIPGNIWKTPTMVVFVKNVFRN